MITTESRGLAERKVVLWVGRLVGYLVYVYLLVVEVILFVGFLLLLFGANPTAGFVEWWYRSLDRVMAPFRGIFTPIHLGTTTGDVEAVFDTSVMFAMIVYGIVALALSAGITWLTGRLHEVYDVEGELRRKAEAEAAAQEYAERLAQAEIERDARARALVQLANQQAAAAAAPTTFAPTTPTTPTAAPATSPATDPASGTVPPADPPVSR